MGRPRLKIDSDLEELLDASGIVWELRPGSRHTKLFVAGRFVQVIPRDRGHDNWHAKRNAEAAVRRAIRAAGGQA